MFDNYDNLPASYVPNNLVCYLPGAPDDLYSLKVYNAKEKLIGYSWVLGDEVTLTFNIEDYIRQVIESIYGEDTNQLITDFMEGKEVEFALYNFRSEAILTEKVQAVTTVTPLSLPSTKLDARVQSNITINTNITQQLENNNYICRLNLIDTVTKKITTFLTCSMYVRK